MNVPTPDTSGAPDEQSPPHQNFTVFHILFDADGLRAIWGILLFLAVRHGLRYCIYPILQALVPYSPDKINPFPPRPVYASEAAALLCVAIATWFLSRLESRPFTAYGLSPQRAPRNFLAGLAWGVTLLSLLVVILRTAGLLVFDARLLYGPAVLRYAAIWLGGFLLVGLSEELFSRGYLQFTLTRGLSEIYRFFVSPSRANALGFWTAALILSFSFGFGHRTNPGESPLGLLSAGLAGFLFCLSLWRTGSLWWAIGFHASWDWAQSFLYGVADSGLLIRGRLYATHPVGRPYLSGGLTGPEGSLYLLPVMFAGIAIIVLSLPRTHLGYLPADPLQPPVD